VVIDDALLLKLYRAMRPGLNTEIELGAALVGDPGAPVPTYRGEVSLYRTWAGRFERHVVALVHDFVPDAGDAFEDLADRLAAWLRAGAPPRALRSLVVDAAPAGRAAARLHVSLAAICRRHFAPRPARPQDIDRWSRRAARAHRAAVRRLRPVDRPLAAWLTDRGVEIDRALEPLAEPGARTLQRIHADLHLGQLLRTGDEFLIVDFEGEPTRSVVERRRLDTPLRDLASMLRSFDHVARSGMRRSGTPLDQVAAGTSAADPAVDAWLEAVRAAFLDAYRAEAASRGLHVDIDRALLHALEVEKELYEFGYAATYLPAWMYAPSAGMRWLLDHPVDA
jgi:trehalose synthase-fused probable maltokinase